MTGGQTDLQKLLLEGLDLHEGDLSQRAEAAFQGALDIDPNQPIALYLCGRMARDADRFEDAAAYLSKCVAIRPDHVEGQFFLGETLCSLGRFDEAAAAYAAALKINDKFPQGHRRLGDALVEAGRPDEAVVCIHRALAMEPERAASHYSLGLALEAQGQIESALDSFRRAEAIDTEHGDAAARIEKLLGALQTAQDGVDTDTSQVYDASETDAATGPGGVLFSQGNLRLRNCRYGRMLYFTNDDFIGQALDFYGEFSEGEASVFRKLVSPGMTAVDIGANLGAHTVCLARAVQPGGTVVAFEPQRVVFQMLCANIANNGLHNVQSFHAASGRADGVLKVPDLNFDAGGNFGGLSLVDKDWGATVPVMPLDNLALEACHFIKIDVEGMEQDVIAGAAKTIGSHRPIMYVENEQVDKSAALISQLFDLDYRLYWHVPPLFNPDNFLGNDKNIYPKKGSSNMICVPRAQDVSLGNFTEIVSPEDRWEA